MPIKEGCNMTEKDPYLELLERQIKRTADLTDDYLSCRQGALSHAWQAVQPDWDPNVKGVRAVAFQCTRCLAIKRQNVSVRYGELMGPPSYEYPEGFMLSRKPTDTGRILSAQAVRAAFVKRVKSALPPMQAIRE
jgi:hypothetical protein